MNTLSYSILIIESIVNRLLFSFIEYYYALIFADWPWDWLSELFLYFGWD